MRGSTPGTAMVPRPTFGAMRGSIATQEQFRVAAPQTGTASATLTRIAARAPDLPFGRLPSGRLRGSSLSA